MSNDSSTNSTRSTSFTTGFTVDQAPSDVFTAINDVRGWWSGEIDGDTDELGDVFTYRYQDIHRSTQQITESIPGRKVVWHVLDAYLDFAQDSAEWTGTDIVFEIAEQGGKTEVRFTHVGLSPQIECYDKCSNAWGFYITASLRSLITTGVGAPNLNKNGNEGGDEVQATIGASVIPSR